MDDTTIANMALQAIGTRSTIASLTEASTEAENANLIYAQTRNELLRKIRWDFARYEAALTVQCAAAGMPENPNGTTLPIPPLPWLYAYQYPEDCSFVRRILPINTQNTGVGITLMPGIVTMPSNFGRTGRWVKYAVGGIYDGGGNPTKVILTNQAQALILYTARIENPNIWDELFVCALIGRLAQKLTIPCSGDKTLARIAIQAGAMAEDEAARTNGNEDSDIVDMPVDWMEARNSADEFAGLFGCDDLG